MAQTFKVGDVVQLKSGGPKMVVNQIKGQGQDVRCEWFIEQTTQKREEGAFLADVLKLAD
jgi:uncharacterized protein YodC (DUF2158 family)